MSRRSTHKPNAAQLAEALKRQGVSITKVAQEFGVSRPTIYAWMREYWGQDMLGALTTSRFEFFLRNATKRKGLTVKRLAKKSPVMIVQKRRAYHGKN